jgi:hypothetical protein
MDRVVSSGHDHGLQQSRVFLQVYEFSGTLMGVDEW